MLPVGRTFVVQNETEPEREETVHVRNQHSFLYVALALTCLAGVPAARGDSISDCFNGDTERRIEACTELIDTPGLGEQQKSLAYGTRALAYSIRRDYGRALPDYDMAISLDPASAIARNNRAWTLLKTGEPEKGLDDVERSLALEPGVAHTYDTRAHILQVLGAPTKALADYERAMFFGGDRMVKLYQCGLHAAGLFRGNVDGLMSPDLRRALVACVNNRACDPLPAGEDCSYTTS